MTDQLLAKKLDLSDCIQTEVEFADGVKVILFHKAPFSPAELSVFKTISYKAFKSHLDDLGFQSFKMGSA